MGETDSDCLAHCYAVLRHVQLFATPWTEVHQAPLSMGFSRQEYWSRLPFPTAGDFPDPGIKPASLSSPTLVRVLFTTAPPGKLGTQWHVYRSEFVSNWLTFGREGLSLLHWLLIYHWSIEQLKKWLWCHLDHDYQTSHLFLSFFLFYSVCQVIRGKNYVEKFKRIKKVYKTDSVKYQINIYVTFIFR